MIVTKIRLQEAHPTVGVSKSWPLPFCDLNLDPTAGENGYILKDAQGIDPPDVKSIVIGFDKFGVPILDSYAPKRYPMFKIGLNPQLGQSYSQLRDDLYKFMSRKILISFMQDSLIIAQTEGYIQHFDSVHFSAQPEIVITFECDDGLFFSPKAIDIPFTSLDSVHPVINYEEGTAPTGLLLKFRYKAVADGTGFTISKYGNYWHSGDADAQNEFKLTYTLKTNDVVTITTDNKKQRISLLRSAVTYDLAGYVNSGAVWPKLYPGVNAFDWTFDQSTWVEWQTVQYTPRFWGV